MSSVRRLFINKFQPKTSLFSNGKERIESMSDYSRRDIVKMGGAFAAASTLPILAHAAEPKGVTDTEVKLGLLHSLSGTFSIAEVGMVDAEMLAIEEINAAGGVLGRKIVPVVQDGASEPSIFAEKANVMLRRDNVAALIACYSSATRKAVLPHIHKAKGILYYPTYYEGLEADDRCLYTAQEATQSVVQGCKYMFDTFGKKFYLIGSDYIYPVTCNKIAKPAITGWGGEVVGEEYVPLAQTEFTSVINRIRAAKPDVIYSTVVGGSNVALYKQLRASGITAVNGGIPLLSTLLVEDQVEGVGVENCEGTYSVMGYYQSLDNPTNKKFIQAFKSKFGQGRSIGNCMEAGYNSVYLWKAAVEKAKTFDPDSVLAASAGLSMDTPQGSVRFDDKNHHLWQKIYIGKVRSDGQFDIVSESADLIAPDPFPKI